MARTIIDIPDPLLPLDAGVNHAVRLDDAPVLDTGDVDEALLLPAGAGWPTAFLPETLMPASWMRQH
ncbi:MAG: hypothetical protein JNJ71_12680 [Rubrivivax sp.]|nr:hypothetical protein [Rubrivivax sp.]